MKPSVPIGFVVAFTGHDVRHAAGRQLQHIGLIPHLVAEPTILGISEGRDEVLETAVAQLTKAISQGWQGTRRQANCIRPAEFNGGGDVQIAESAVK